MNSLYFSGFMEHEKQNLRANNSDREQNCLEHSHV